MTCGIYKITNKTNGKTYIGASKNIEKRWGAHKSYSVEMSDVIKEFGVNNFSFEVLEECSEDEFYDKEREYIKIYNAQIPIGYNKSPGGEHNFNTTGYYHVCKLKDLNVRNGFRWMYTYYDNEGNKKTLSNVDLNQLKEKVIHKGLPWKVIDVENAIKSDECNISRGVCYTNRNTTGFYNVCKIADEELATGYFWSYYCDVHKNIRRVDLDDLKNEVLSQGFHWEIVDEEKARISDEINKKNKKIINKRKNKTGYYNVSKYKNSWRYTYRKNNKPIAIKRANLNELKKEVLHRGLKWEILDKQMAELSNIENEKLKDIRKNTVKNNTGFLRVSKVNCKRCPKGFKYVYSYYVDGKQKRITARNIFKLEEKIKRKGFEWRIVDKNKVKELINQETLDSYK